MTNEELTITNEEDRISYLNFCCGMMLGTLVSIRGRVDIPEAERIGQCLALVEPMIKKIYEFQANL